MNDQVPQVFEQNDPLKYHSERLAERLEVAFNKLHRAYDLVEDRTLTTVFSSLLVVPRAIMHFNRFRNGNREWNLGRHVENVAATEKFGKIQGKDAEEERYFMVKARVLGSVSSDGHYGPSEVENSSIYVSEDFKPNRSPDGNGGWHESWESYSDFSNKKPVVRLDEINDGEISERAATAIADAYMSAVKRHLVWKTYTVNKNETRIDEAAELLSAVIQDPSLEPEDFFNGYKSRKREKVAPIELPTPDIKSAKAKLEEDMTALREKPSSSNVTSFGNDEAMAAGQASTTISDWQIRQAMSPPLSFHYMKQISAIVADITGENGTTATLLEKDSTGQYTSEMAGKLRQISSIGRKAKNEIPKDLEATEEQMRQEETAREIISAHAEITDLAYTMFAEELPALKEVKLNPASESDERRFSSTSLDIKAQTLQQTRLITQQKQAALQYTNGPIGEALMLSLPQMMNDVDRMMQFAQRVHEVVVMSKITSDTKGNAAFAGAAQGIRLNQSKIERFQAMSPDDQKREITRNLRQLRESAQKWDETIADVETAILPIEHQEAPKLLLTDQTGDMNELVIRLQAEVGPDDETNVVELGDLTKES